MKLFVARLPFQWNDRDLLKMFSPYGAVSAEIKLDYNSGRSRGFGFVEVPDAKLAARAINDKNDTIVDNSQRRIVVQEGEKPSKRKPQGGNPKRANQPPVQTNSGSEENPAFPYRFAARNPGKMAEPPFHDKLDRKRYDVAFEVEWVTKTPVVANPCTDPNEKNKSCPNTNTEKDEYTGYDKRWFRVGGKLAISPFTVKSAIANGFANLLGGCIRVPAKEDPHADQGEGKYPYNGAYKRYRVDMGGKSKPGIIKNIRDVDGGKEFEIEMVKKEFFYDKESLPFPIASKTVVDALIEPRPNKKNKDKPDKNKPWNIVDLKMKGDKKKILPKPTGWQKTEELRYHGLYSWGMDPYAGGAKSKFGKTKPWRHRFYTRPDPVETIKGTIPAWQFEDKPDLEKKMFMGRDQINDPPDPKHRWFQKIDDLKKYDWVYYEEFNGQVTHIGKSFLFKAPFYHPDTVPSDQSKCNDIMEKLCPRCAMFGMTDEKKRDKRPSVGYRGRFKASALVCHENLKEVNGAEEKVPVKSGNTYRNQDIAVKAWSTESNEKDIKCRQFLLPIQGQPKPNKRDTDGYFDSKTGLVKGIKTYRHSLQDVGNLTDLEKFIKKTDSRRTLADSQPQLFVPNPRELQRLSDLDYSHNLRSWAEVCDAGMTFKGTLGAENCSDEEIAAILLLLDVDQAGHGFKIGTGKALGLGSVESHIKKIWIRKPEKYDEWIPKEIANPQSLIKTLQEQLPKVKAALETLKKIGDLERRINLLDKNKLPLAYPPPGILYWRHARNTGLNELP